MEQRRQSTIIAAAAYKFVNPQRRRYLKRHYYIRGGFLWRVYFKKRFS